MDTDENHNKRLEYDICRYSSFSGNYRPENILMDTSSDQGSRWSSDSNQSPQFLVLTLKKPAVVRTIGFGKFEKTHVCNLKRFKVFGGLTEDSYVELLDSFSGLKNDSTPEIFALRHTIDEKPFPCSFLKIVPLQSWGPSFNFSIWYVELTGDDRECAVQSCLDWYSIFREKEAMRLCLKFLRDHNHIDICEDLQKRSGIDLEHASVSKLYDTLVRQSDFREAEKILEARASEGVFNEYVENQIYDPIWCPVHAHPNSETPGMRGGHQMVLDQNNRNPNAHDKHCYS